LPELAWDDYLGGLDDGFDGGLLDDGFGGGLLDDGFGGGLLDDGCLFNDGGKGGFVTPELPILELLEGSGLR
jgi:hypothetical protein